MCQVVFHVIVLECHAIIQLASGRNTVRQFSRTLEVVSHARLSGFPKALSDVKPIKYSHVAWEKPPSHH
jgi:hypothetical protein